MTSWVYGHKMVGQFLLPKRDFLFRGGDRELQRDFIFGRRTKKISSVIKGGGGGVKKPKITRYFFLQACLRKKAQFRLKKLTVQKDNVSEPKWSQPARKLLQMKIPLKCKRCMACARDCAGDMVNGDKQMFRFGAMFIKSLKQVFWEIHNSMWKQISRSS